MAFQAAKEFLEKRGFGDRIKEFDVSSATVELAAVAEAGKRPTLQKHYLF